MATETVRDFLVRLGYQNDDSGLKKFTDSVNSANRTVTNFIHALEAVVTGALASRVIQGFTNFARGLEDLYFASRRTGASVTSLKILDRAAQDLGASAGEAVSAVEAMSLAIVNPGNRGLLHTLIGDFKKAKDGSDDMMDAFTRLVKVFKSDLFSSPGMKNAAYTWAAQIGIPPDLLQIMLKGNLPGSLGNAGRMLGGVDWDAAAKGAHEFGVQWRNLGDILGSFSMEVWTDLNKQFGWSLKSINDWLQAHRAEIVHDIHWIFETIKEGVTWIRTNGPKIIEWFDKANTATDGWAGKLAVFGAIVAATGPGSLVGGIASLAGGLASLSAAFIRLGIAAAPVLVTVGGVAAALTAVYAVTQAIQGKDASNWISDMVIGPVGKGFDWLADLLRHTGPRGLRNNNPGNLKFAGQAGATGADAEGFAIFGNPYQGMLAMAKQLELYSGRGLNTIRGIVGRWTAGDPAADQAGYRQDLMRRLGMGADTALNLRDPAVLTNLMGAMSSHENNGPVPYMGMMGAAAQAAIINYNNNTQNTVHAHGGDSHEVARQVAGKLAAISSEKTRNNSKAVE